MTDNPFLESWTTPFGMPPFDRIRPAHFPPAFNRGMEEQIAQIAAIASSTAPPSFADYGAAETSRTPAKILAHLGDLMDWALAMAEGRKEWRDSLPLPPYRLTAVGCRAGPD